MENGFSRRSSARGGCEGCGQSLTPSFSAVVSAPELESWPRRAGAAMATSRDRRGGAGACRSPANRLYQ